MIERSQFDPISLKRWDIFQASKKNFNTGEASSSQLITVPTEKSNKHETSTSQTKMIEEHNTVNGNVNADSVSPCQSFEELLLNTMNQSGVNKTTSKRRV